MDNHIQSSESKTKNITLKSTLAWVIGVLFVLAGIGELFSKPFAGIILLIAAGITMPPAYEFIKNKLHISLSTGVRTIIVIILMVISGSLMGNMDKSKQEVAQNKVPQEQQKAEVVEQKPEIIKVSAIQLYDAYQANEVSADAQYKGKTVQISGVVNSIAKDIVDTPYITLKTSESSFFNVQCVFSKTDEALLTKIQKGQSIVLQGEVSGKMGNVLIRGCSIVGN